MAQIRDFEPILPDPQPYVEKALALYERAVRERRGRIVFIAAELGGGKTDLLNALAQALHRSKPEPNFVAGFFRGGEYHPHTLDWQAKVCFRKAVQAVGAIASLLGFYPGIYAFAAGFIGQLLQTSASAHEFGNEFKQHPDLGKERVAWFRKLLRLAVEEKPLLCLLDDWDEAQRYYWDDMVLSLSREIAQDLPLLLFLTVKGPINLAAPEKDESGLTMVIKTLTEKGLAECWPLQKLSRDEVVNSIGQAVPGIAAKLHGVTGGNANWVKEVWREWRLNDIVVMNEAECWVWGDHHNTTINLYDDILRDRLARLLKAEAAMQVETAREVLACGALEGIRFTADAVALALGWARDDLIDFLDETLVQSEDNPDGILLEDDSVNIRLPDGKTRTLWRYSFVSELHWLALERCGFANEERPDKSDSERLEKSAALAKALEAVYAPEERLVAAPLARLLRDIGHRQASLHYQRQSHYSANREVMREHALHLLAVNKDDWDRWQCALAAQFLIEAGKVMLDAFSYVETLSILENATKLAHRAKCESDEAYAHYLCSIVSRGEGDYKSARNRANVALDIFSRIREKAGIAASLHLLAQIDDVEGRYIDARRRAMKALQITQAIGDRGPIATSLHLLSQIDYAEGHYDDARRQARRALEINQAIGNRNGTALSLFLLAETDFAEGHYEDARRQATLSFEIQHEIGNRTKSADSLHLLADISYVEGRYDESRRQATESLNINEAIGDLGGAAISLHLLSQIDYAEGRYGDALRLAAQSLKINQRIGSLKVTTSSLHILGGIAYKIQRPKEAYNLITLGVLILSENGIADPHKLRNSLATIVAGGNYSEEQIIEMSEQVLDAYRKDGWQRYDRGCSRNLNQGCSLKKS